MILDELDIKILRQFYNLVDGENVNLWRFVKDLFPGVVEQRELTKKYTFVVSRIKRMSMFFEIKENGRCQYTLDEEKISFLDKYLKSNRQYVFQVEDNICKVYSLLKSF